MFNETHSQVCLWWCVTATVSSVGPYLRHVRRFLRARLAGRGLCWAAWSPPLEGWDSSPASSWRAAFGAHSSASGRCCLAGGAPPRRLTCTTLPLRHSVTARCAVLDHDLCRRPRQPLTDDCDRLGQPRDPGCLHGGWSRLGNSSRGGRRGRTIFAPPEDIPAADGTWRTETEARYCR